MPYRLLQSPTLIEVTLGGTVTSRTLLTFAQEVAALEAPAAVSRNLLTTFSGIDGWKLDSNEMRQYAEARAKTTLKNHIKSAIVAPNDLDFGMARMFELMMQSQTIEVMVFRDEQAARQWLEDESAADLSGGPS